MWPLARRFRLVHAYLKCQYTQRFRTFAQKRPMQRIGFVVSPGFQVLSFAASSAFEFANREMANRSMRCICCPRPAGPCAPRWASAW